ncbi:thiamine pyrophosphate-binding protein [Alteribacillus sp. YIM 98480]|uniref:thiamine pyrophosphate-binding protein n=1 Tax=Alteribacillus sp. YIM 98480 TaxID=2606599 RepID=UPI00131E079D|nr:thiamine pyrophosphate-dependent enzyme [Alteribacillus sp. YIM 98480]
MGINGAQAIVHCLEKEDVTHVFGVPGEQILAFVDAIYDAPSLEFISTRHEGGASFMAEAFGKTTNKPAVCIGTSGVGASNLTLGIHTAHQDSTPMIVIIGQVNSKYRGREAWQEIDLDFFYSHIAKWSVEIKNAARIPEIMHQAVHLSKTGRPGPVVISVPEDILSENTEVEAYFSLNIKKPSISLTDAKEIIALLNKSENPLIFAGGGITASNAKHELIQFSEQSGIPVMSAFRRHDVFPNDHPHYLGNSGLGSFPELMETLIDSDLIFAIGTRLSEVSTQGYSFPTKNQTVIHLDVDEKVIVKQSFSSQGFVSDAKNALNLLLEQVSNLTFTTTNKEWAQHRKKIYEEVLLERKQNRIKQHIHGISMEKLVDSLYNILPDDAVITSDAGTFYTWFANYYPFHANQRYLGPTSGAMGYGLPSAIAAKLIFPERTVISLSGDGGLMMTIQELETAVRYHIPIISLVFNNNSYGAIRLHQERLFPNRVTGSTLKNPPFDELSKLFGGYGYKVTTNEDFIKVFKKALKNDKPTLIEVPMNLKLLSASKGLDNNQLRNI